VLNKIKIIIETVQFGVNVIWCKKVMLDINLDTLSNDSR